MVSTVARIRRVQQKQLEQAKTARDFRSVGHPSTQDLKRIVQAICRQLPRYGS
jgi:hypothetical protein